MTREWYRSVRLTEPDSGTVSSPARSRLSSPCVGRCSSVLSVLWAACLVGSEVRAVCGGVPECGRRLSGRDRTSAHSQSQADRPCDVTPNVGKCYSRSVLSIWVMTSLYKRPSGAFFYFLFICSFICSFVCFRFFHTKWHLIIKDNMRHILT